MALDVVGKDRLLDPEQIKALQSVDGPTRCGSVPPLVGANHTGHVGPDQFPHQRHALDILRQVRFAYFDLDGLVTSANPASHLLLELFETQIEVDPASVSINRAPMLAEEVHQ